MEYEDVYGPRSMEGRSGLNLGQSRRRLANAACSVPPMQQDDEEVGAHTVRAVQGGTGVAHTSGVVVVSTLWR